ncbi:RNA degradosome polyphosphate kinase [Nitriliruptoraceae bacterium ZYF776]|nr:RNA degradosome polyphosphate kinase [Profundirhabdus halotolerans]
MPPPPHRATRQQRDLRPANTPRPRRAARPARPPRPAGPTTVTNSILEYHDDDARYLNRELSWLQFNERVLALAEDPGQPLLERAKYLAIFAGNLDEFFQVRVAGLKEQLAAEVLGTGADGMDPGAQLAAIDELVTDLGDRHARTFRDEIVPQLADQGIWLSDWDELDDEDRTWLDEAFETQVFPVLTPLAVDPAHPFPYISNLSLNLAVVVRDPADDELRFARIKVPPILPRFVVLPDGERFVPLEQVIATHLDRLFPGLEVVDHHVFRVTRNADLVVEEEEADDLLAAIEHELTRRRFGRVVRLEVEPTITDEVRDLLVRELDVREDDVHVLPGPLDLAGLWALYDLDRPKLKHDPFVPTTQPRLSPPPGEDGFDEGAPRARGDLFATLREGDVLVQHPYDSFATSVQAFVETAAHDPRVLAIKQTLYRTSGPGSPIVKALLTAAEEGKQVVALVELKARFDEEANIEWARVLEEAGVHVAYGVVGYKTHTKISLVVRDEGGGRVRRYAHIGTGNYNDKTARIYEDLGLLTADPDLGADLTDLFNVLTGYSRQQTYRKLLVAPTTLLPRLLELIEREAAAPDGRIVAKMNSLVDPEIIDALYDASQRGTPIDLVVRGICALRPGVPGLSENIRVRSIVGRYLEHSRIFRFGNDERGYEFLLGSADWMNRNLRRRVEAVTPVEDPALQARLEEILRVNLADDVLAWELGPDAVWTKIPTVTGTDTHLELQQRARERSSR